jgi:hypothetical protein
MAGQAQQGCSQRAYHVDHNEAQDRWDVVDESGTIIGHCHDQGEAIDLAIREAQYVHGRGDDVVVCVEQPDGHYSLAWAPHKSRHQ